ncbi:unnamed protein product [Chilo suppressalis]|uniref:Chemosensory protein n=1 Tax=Chilo suppressalis TaxID=168631 RepID=A0ABN8B5S8_CHISP|nr:unnamed protein product [Chilo suppressalis]
MKLLIIAVAFAIPCVLAQTKSYTNKYDTVNLDQVLSNRRLLHAYIKCTLDKGKCTSEGRELKSHIAEALQNGCEKCTNAQRAGMKRVIKHLMTYEKAYWTQLVEKFDPAREYSQKYEKELSTL